MKKTIEYMQLWLLAGMLLAVGCTADFEDLNRNPNQVTDSQMDVMNYKTGTKVKALQSLVVPVQEHMYQFNESLVGGPFGGYIGATVDTWRTKFETFNPSADWRKWPFANVITETYTPYRGIVNGTEDEVAIAFAKLLRVAIMHRVTDSCSIASVRPVTNSLLPKPIISAAHVRNCRVISHASRNWPTRPRLSRTVPTGMPQPIHLSRCRKSGRL